MTRLLCVFAVILSFIFTVSQPTSAAPHSVTLNWTDSDSTTTGIGYNIFRAPGACSTSSVFTKLNTSPVTALTFVDSTVSLGNSYCYQVTAELSGGPDSAPSNQVTATVNLPAPPVLGPPGTN